MRHSMEPVSCSQHMSLSGFLQNKLLPKKHCTWSVRDCEYPDPARSSDSPEDLNRQGAPSYPFEQDRRPDLRWSLFWLHHPFDLSVQYFACIKSGCIWQPSHSRNRDGYATSLTLFHVFFKRFNILTVAHNNEDVSLLNLIIGCRQNFYFFSYGFTRLFSYFKYPSFYNNDINSIFSL